MPIAQLPLAYIKWHLGVAWVDLWRLYVNIVWFLSNLFSLTLLSATLFSPWRRLHEEKAKGSGGIVGKLIINSITRTLGAIIRLGVIFTGLVSICIFSILFAGLFVVWIAVPLIAIGFSLAGLQGLLTAVISL